MERPVPADAGPQQEADLPDFSVANLGFRPPPKAVDEVTAPATASPVPAAAAKVRPRAIFVVPPRVPAKTVPSPGLWPSEPASGAAVPEAQAQSPLARAGQTGSDNQHDWLEQALVGVEPDEKAESKPAGEEAEPDLIAENEQPAVPAVVGRYESNGASYVLFDDGSIEAETDSDVYHFASMAELKKFIEGRA
jgi:hypothetical protein